MSRANAAAMLMISQAANNDPDFANVFFLCHADGTAGSSTFTNVVAALGRGGGITNGGGLITVDTTNPLFGTGAASFPGTTNNALLSGSTDYAIGTQDFTIEGASRTGTPSQTAALTELRSTVTDQGPQFGIFGGQFFIFNTAGLFQQFGTVATNAYQQWSYTRAAGTGYCAVGGTILATVADTTNYTNVVNQVLWGCAFNGASPFSGLIDEMRLTIGVGRYTSNYTVASGPFPDS